MKKILLFALLFASALSARAQTHTQFLTFDDLGLGGGTATSGTYNPNDTFSFDVYLTYDGYNAIGYSFWLEAESVGNFAGSLSIIDVTYGTVFYNVNQFTPNPAPFNDPLGASSGYLTEDRDLGAIGFHPPGTYFIAHITFSVIGATAGTYILQSTTVSPHVSEVGERLPSGDFVDHFITTPAQYTITIVPEPATLTLVALGALGLGIVCRKRSTSSRTT